MYKQEKEYVVLAKDGKKLADAGLCKLSVLGKKIRVEYFLKQLPIYYDMEMECELRFRMKEEMTKIQRWRETLSRGNSHYVFSLILREEVAEIVDCCLVLQGNQMIVRDEKLSVKENLQSEQPVERKIESRQTKLEYIRDLEYLKDGNEEMQELYYNSFLLHGFYQYQYVVLGKNFIGVPDHFYEREAIAARMMGFPYFVEAEFLECCEIDGEIRKEFPKQGSFGYYLRKISPHRAETQMES